MLRDIPLHNFLFETDPDGFYQNLDCYCTPWIDVCVLLHLVRRYRPARFLEIGTHRGHTTRILAEKFPSMSIDTVDPGDQIAPESRPANQSEEYLGLDEVGVLVRDAPNVRVHKREFHRVEWPKDQRFEMIFIDGNHTLEWVLKDSHLALRLLTDPGVIVWHDCHNVPDVNLALEQLEWKSPIVSVHNTWMAYLDTHHK